MTNGWRQGATDPVTGITEILGNYLRLKDQREIRRRYNGSLALDLHLRLPNF
ncbi:MAG: hypothetical protein H6577_16910 [Lewinellaceae bacterium]|nr:hypothetical protein [Saprospiraceae bacterium]MCB9339807.1 hypothetical protein [Lewinellaceae bacterium]